MIIDWFTVAAQAVNFLILVWLLKRFLYKPILDAIDEREKRIATELADADSRKAEAAKERDELQVKTRDFDQQRAGLLSKATDEAKAERQRLLGEARQSVDALRLKGQQTLKSDAENLNQAISRQAQREVFAIARKALKDLATASLEERMVGEFTRRLRAIDGPAKEQLAAALKKTSEPSIVHSTFNLPDERRTALQQAVNETFSADIHLHYETAPDLIAGIELISNGQKVAWSIAEYLDSMEQEIGELIRKPTKPDAPNEVKLAPKPVPEKVSA